MEAAPRARRVPHPRAAAVAPRRTHRGRRSGGAPRVLGPHPRARPPGNHGARQHALHGRGGALPRARLHRIRQAARARHHARGDRGRGPIDVGDRIERRRPVDEGRRRGPREARRRDGGAFRQCAACKRHRPAGPPRRARDARRPTRPRRARSGGQPRGRVHPSHARPGRCRGRGHGDALAMFAFHRFSAVLMKEFVQMRRDPLTFAMMIGVPVMQLVLFGYAINMDPKALPAAVVSADSSPFSRSLVRALENTGYFKVVATPATVGEADRLLTRGNVQFVLQVPEDFSRKLQRGERATVLVEADATDPAATSNALGALAQVGLTGLDHDLTGTLAAMKSGPAPFEIRVHRRYNPEGITQYNIVPGLMSVVLTMTMVMMTSIAMTR